MKEIPIETDERRRWLDQLADDMALDGEELWAFLALRGYAG